MKRNVPILLIVLLCVTLASCGKTTETRMPNSIYNKETGVAISLGMPKGEVETLLGTEKIEEFRYPENGEALFQDTRYGENENRIAISFTKDDTVDYIAIGCLTGDELNQANHQESNWYDKFGLSTGKNTKEDVFQKYGEKETLLQGKTEGGRIYSLYDYGFDDLGNPVDPLENATYMVGFSVYEDDASVCLIRISSINTEELETLPSD